MHDPLILGMRGVRTLIYRAVPIAYFVLSGDPYNRFVLLELN